MSAKEIIAACQQRGSLIDELRPLQDERDRLAQVIENYGFLNKAAQQEELGQKAGDILRKNGISHDFRDVSIDQAKTAMEGYLKNLEQINRPLNTAERNTLIKAAQHLPREAREAILALSKIQQAPVPGSAAWQAALKSFGTVSGLYKVAESESQARQAWEGVMMAAGEVNPAFGLIVSEADFVANELIDLKDLAVMARQIAQLTHATEADLLLLKTTSAQMARTGSRIGAINRALVGLPPCDSTQLVRSEQPVPAVPAAEKPKSGPSAGKVIGGVVAAAGAGVGALIAIDYAKKAIDRANVPAPSGGSTSGGGTTSSTNRFDGTYRAVVSSKSCTQGPADSSGIPNPCASITAANCPVSGGAPAAFTFTVRNGVVTDPCFWLVSASVASSGTFTGRYTGTAANSFTLTGTFTTSGSFTLSGSGVGQNNTYRTTLQVTKQ
jgi:hypothetical protein